MQIDCNKFHRHLPEREKKKSYLLIVNFISIPSTRDAAISHLPPHFESFVWIRKLCLFSNVIMQIVNGQEPRATNNNTTAVDTREGKKKLYMNKIFLSSFSSNLISKETKCSIHTQAQYTSKLFFFDAIVVCIVIVCFWHA